MIEKHRLNNVVIFIQTISSVVRSRKIMNLNTTCVFPQKQKLEIFFGGKQSSPTKQKSKSKKQENTQSRVTEKIEISCFKQVNQTNIFSSVVTEKHTTSLANSTIKGTT